MAKANKTAKAGATPNAGPEAGAPTEGEPGDARRSDEGASSGVVEGKELSMDGLPGVGEQLPGSGDLPPVVQTPEAGPEAGAPTDGAVVSAWMEPGDFQAARQEPSPSLEGEPGDARRADEELVKVREAATAASHALDLVFSGKQTASIAEVCQHLDTLIGAILVLMAKEPPGTADDSAASLISLTELQHLRAFAGEPVLGPDVLARYAESVPALANEMEAIARLAPVAGPEVVAPTEEKPRVLIGGRWMDPRHV